MTEPSAELANLARIGKLAAEPGAAAEIAGLLASGRERLHDARNVAEYEGVFEADAQLLRSLIEAAGKVAAAVTALPTLDGSRGSDAGG